MAALSRGEPAEIASIYAAQASLEELRGDKISAVTLLKKAVEAQSDEAWYRCELALLYKDQGDYASAASHLSEALQRLRPDIAMEFRARLEAELLECRRKAPGPAP